MEAGEKGHASATVMSGARQVIIRILPRARRGGRQSLAQGVSPGERSLCTREAP